MPLTRLASTTRNALRREAIRGGLALAGSSLFRHFAFARGNGMVLTLHHVLPMADGQPFSPNAHLAVTPDFLDRVIRIVREQGYIIAALADMPDLVLGNPGKRFVAFSLDDGYRDNRDHAAPVFRRHKVPYTIFVTKGFAEHRAPLWWIIAERLLNRVEALVLDMEGEHVLLSAQSVAEKQAAFDHVAGLVHGGQEQNVVDALCRAAETAGMDPLGPTRELLMSAEELRELSRADPLCRFGAHTVSHPNLARIQDEDRLQAEIGGSIDFLAALTGEQPTTFAYPYGMRCAVDDRAVEAVEAAGLALAVTTQPGVLTPASFEGRNARHLPRVSLNGLYQTDAAVRGLLSGLAFTLKG